MTREIALKRGGVALVDDGDFALLSLWQWTSDSRGYAMRQERVPSGQRPVLMHRVIMGAESGQIVDHKSGVKLDNRRANLRFATVGQNNINSRRANASGY